MSVSKKIDNIVEFMQEQVKNAGSVGVVLGLSGGIDSALVAALAKRAFGDNVLGVIMPCYSNPEDKEHGMLVAKTFGIPIKEVDLGSVFDQLLLQLTGESYDVHQKELAVANIKPRLRMTTLYFWAAHYNYLVAGTGNRSEAFIGYFTKHGDSGVDFLPIANLVKAEVRELAKALGVPDEIINKAPSAGLWLNQTDEEEMGFSYEELDNYIITGEASPKVKTAIDTMHTVSEHKRKFAAIPQSID